MTHSKWQLHNLLQNMHSDIEHQLQIARQSFQHPGTKGDASESIWCELFNTYLPERYRTAEGFVVDSKNQFSDQMDMVVFDRQYSPLIFHHGGKIVVPAESVYAVFEVKQEINLDYLAYAQKKAATVRRLHRNNLPMKTAGASKLTKPTEPRPILAGLLGLEGNFTKAMQKCDAASDDVHRMNLICSARRGWLSWRPVDLLPEPPDDSDSDFLARHQKILARQGQFQTKPHAVVHMLFDLIDMLRLWGTVPALDVLAYGEWLEKTSA